MAVRFVIGLIAALLTTSVAALDFRSVGETAILYDAPSQKAKPLFVIAAGTPVEVIVSLDVWSKVRDSTGDLTWIERRLLTERRTLQVRGVPAMIHAEPSEDSGVVFAAEPDVLLEFLETAVPGWIRVRHRDGQHGFIKAARVWGG